MQVHWKQKWLMFDHLNSVIKLQGILPKAVMGPPITSTQLQAMQKHDSVLFLVQLNAVEDSSDIAISQPPEISDLIHQFAPLFQEPTGLPPHRPRDHQIPLIAGAQPFRLRPYRYNPAQKDEIERQVAEMLEKGWIQFSTSPYSSPILLVKKKTGDWRLCVDFRRLNALTVKNKYPLPIIDEILDELFGACWFTSLDMC